MLHGERRELDARLERRQAELVEQLAFEQAAKVQEHRELLASTTRTVRRLREAAASWAVLAYPARQAAAINLLGVACGSIVAQEHVRPERFTEADALAFVTRVYRAEPPQPPLPPSAVDEILLIGSWLRQHRAAPNVLTLSAPHRPDASCAETPRPTTVDVAAAAQELLQRLPVCGRA